MQYKLLHFRKAVTISINTLFFHVSIPGLTVFLKTIRDVPEVFVVHYYYNSVVRGSSQTGLRQQSRWEDPVVTVLMHLHGLHFQSW